MSDSILRMFTEDTREHLADIENTLIDIEEAGDQYDIELINRVFRTAHTIKGSASYLNLYKIRDLAQSLENILDLIRNEEMAPNPKIIDLILRAFDRLGELVENAEDSEQMNILEHTESLTELIKETLPAEEKTNVSTIRELTFPDGRPAFTLTEYDFQQALKGGNYLYIIEYDLIHDIQRKGLTPLELIKFLERSGRFLDCRLDLASVGDLMAPASNKLPFHILFASILEPDLAPSLFRIDKEYIHLIEDDATEKKESIFEGIELSGPQEANAEEVEALEAEWNSAAAKLNDEVETEQEEAPAPNVSQAIETVEGFGLRVDGRRCILILTGDVAIDRAEKLKSALLDVMARFTKVEIDMTGVDRTDLSILQLICAAHKNATDMGVEMTCHGTPSEEYIDTMRRAGLIGVNPERCGQTQCLYQEISETLEAEAESA